MIPRNPVTKSFWLGWRRKRRLQADLEIFALKWRILIYF